MGDCEIPSTTRDAAAPIGSTGTCPVDEAPIKIVLRSSKGLVSKRGSTPSTELNPDYLPEFLHADETECQLATPAKAFKKLETRFYIDLAKQEGASWYARRKITAVLTKKGHPELPEDSNISVQWEISLPGSTNLTFETSAGTEHPSPTVTTGPEGWAEVTIKHVVKDVPKGKDNKGRDNREVTLKATRLDTNEFATVDLYITRNDDVKSLDEVMKKKGYADAILVFHPAADVKSDAVGAEGISFNKGLNHILNQVVSRHKGIDRFAFIDEDGFYGVNTKTAVQQFITKFTSVVKGARCKPIACPSDHWPYDLSKVGVYKSLKAYVEKEYVDFAYQDGLIVDSHLLIGEEKDDTPAKIDGLQELKTGVVDKLVEKMTAVAKDYIESDRFWLHRPEDLPYVHGDAPADVVVTTQIAVSGSPGGQPLFPSVFAPIGQMTCLDHQCVGTVDWYKIAVSANQSGPSGWISIADISQVFMNDKVMGGNTGKGGGDDHYGVAYSFGCKEAPDEFRAQINANIPDPDHILNWHEYTTEHKPGLYESEFNIYKADKTKSSDGYNPDSDYCTLKWTGVDCSGFCQHCITRAQFDDNKTQIVPDCILSALTKRGQGLQRGTDVVDTQGVLDPYARGVPYYYADKKRQWIRGGDVIASDDHIVWVKASAEKAPGKNEDPPSSDFTPNAIKEGGDFYVYNAWGGRRPIQGKFSRKTIEMQFSHWGLSLLDIPSNIAIGRVYIWT